MFLLTSNTIILQFIWLAFMKILPCIFSQSSARFSTWKCIKSNFQNFFRPCLGCPHEAPKFPKFHNFFYHHPLGKKIKSLQSYCKPTFTKILKKSHSYLRLQEATQKGLKPRNWSLGPLGVRKSFKTFEVAFSRQNCMFEFWTLFMLEYILLYLRFVYKCMLAGNLVVRFLVTKDSGEQAASGEDQCERHANPNTDSQ